MKEFLIESYKRLGYNLSVLRRYVDRDGDTYNFKMCVLPRIMEEVKWFTMIFKRDDLKKYRKLYKKLYQKPLKAIGIFMVNNANREIKNEVFEFYQKALKAAETLLQQEKNNQSI